MSGLKGVRPPVWIAAMVCILCTGGSVLAGWLASMLYSHSDVEGLHVVGAAVGGAAGLMAGLVWSWVMWRWSARLRDGSIDALVRLRRRGLALAMAVGVLAAIVLHLSLIRVSEMWEFELLLAAPAFALPASIALGEVASSAWARRLRG